MAPAGTRQERKADPSLLRRAGTNVRHPPSPRLRRAGGMTTGRMCRTYGAPEKHLKTIIVRPRTQGSRLRQTPSAATARQARPGLKCAAPCLPAGRLRGFKQFKEKGCQPPDGVGTGSGWRYKMRGGWARQNETRAKSRSLPPRRAGTSVRDPPSPRLRRGKRLRRAGGMTTLRIEAKPHPLSAAADKGWATRCVPRPDLGFR
jgi:hypothetical protein